MMNASSALSASTSSSSLPSSPAILYMMSRPIFCIETSKSNHNQTIQAWSDYLEADDKSERCPDGTEHQTIQIWSNQLEGDDESESYHGATDDNDNHVLEAVSYFPDRAFVRFQGVMEEEGNVVDSGQPPGKGMASS